MDEYSLGAVADELSAWGCQVKVVSRDGWDLVAARVESRGPVVFGAASGRPVTGRAVLWALEALGIDEASEFTYYVGRRSRHS